MLFLLAVWLLSACSLTEQAKKDKCLILLIDVARRRKAVQRVAAILRCVFNNHFLGGVSCRKEW